MHTRGKSQSVSKNNLFTSQANYVWYVSQWLQFMILLISASRALLWEKRVCGLSIASLCVQPWRSPCTTCSSSHQSLVLNPRLLYPVFLFRAPWSIKTIFLMFVLFTPVLDHPWMSTLRRMVASGRIILFQSQTVCPFKSSSTKATLMYALCPLHPAWHSKSLWEHKRALLIRFHQCIIWMSFFLLATHLNHVHASCCVDVWYL